MKITRAWLVAVCIPAALIAAASSSAQASPSTTTGGTLPAAVGSPALCKAVGRLDKLVVRRMDAFPQNGIHFSFPAVVEVDRVSSVRYAARIVCDLPPMPAGKFACPLDLGITYRLSFTAPGRMFRTVVVAVTGCELVSGLGRTRWVARSPHFWHRLGKAMGLVDATYATFRGTPASG
ncbi:MAG: hypothetical protein WAV54_02245 [Acidimicrobiales bacterium]